MKPDTFAVASYNLYNFFDRQNGTRLRLEKHARAIVEVLECPALLLVQETGSEEILRRLGRRVDDFAGTAYRVAAPPTSDRRGIRVGLIWDERQISVDRIEQLQGPGVAEAFGERSAHPAREPLVGRFRIGDWPLTVVACHLKSDYVPDEQVEQRDELLAASAAQRAAQARVIRELVQPAPGEWFLVGGDMNGTPAAEPLRILQSAGDAPLVNLLPERGPAGAYTFFSEERGPLTLDHLLASPTLAARCVAVQAPHANTAASPQERLNPQSPRGASDHDPLLAHFLR